MRRRRTLALAVTPLALILTPLAPTATAGPAAPVAEPEDLTPYVNAFVGTQNFGNTFPGASAPFGMVQVSPDTGGQGGYDYTKNTMYGFSQTHLSGVGCEVMGELPIMPTSGQVTATDHDAYASEFSHDNEAAEPGYYRVHLDRYGIDAELTATPRTGWQRYTFPTDGPANVLFNTGKAQQRVFDSEVRVVGDRRIVGRIHAGNFCAGLDRHTVYFAAEFDRPFDSFGTWRDDTLSTGSRQSGNAGPNGAWVTFDPADDADVVLKVGLSYTNVAGARRNLEAETGDGFDFDATRQALHDEWNAMLHRVEIEGGSEERRTAFYTALYHSLVHPNLAGDVDGRYRGFDGEIHTARGYTPYQNFSLWDTYRPQNQLLALLAPDVARDTYRSVVAHGREGGWLPRWSLANSETNIMTGDPVTPFLVEGWAKGLLRGDAAAQAYQLLRKNATGVPPKDSPYNGRAGQEYYAERGYIPHGLDREADCAHKGGDNDCSHGVSATLEYAAADGSLSLMAAGLGKTRDAKLFASRAQSYRNLWDQRIDHFRPRTLDGVWLDSYDPAYGASAFHEGGAFQYQWLAPQDPDGLVETMGGREATAQRLDDFFAYEDLLTDPEGTAREKWVRGPFEYYGKATYNPNNEPDLLAPYMYAWVGEPHKTATVVRAAMTLFTTGPDGMTGNDDLGTMSAWYVLSSMGLYPTMSGGNFFVLTSPQFEQVRVQIGEYGQQGGELTVSAPGTTDERRYVTAATLNGNEWSKPWLPWWRIRDGGEIAYEVSDQPGEWGTAERDRPPSVVSGPGVPRRTVDAALSPAEVAIPVSDEAEVARLSAAVLVQAPGEVPVTLRTAAPDGWQVEPHRRTVRIGADHAPIQRDVPIDVTVPANTQPGRYNVTTSVAAPGVPRQRVSATVVVSEASCAATGDAWCAIDLTDALNHDGTATVAQPESGNFDGGGWSYDADLLPAAGPVEWGGTTYDAPDATGTASNFLEAAGESVLLPEGTYGQLRVVGAAHGGNMAGEAVVTYADGTTGAVPLELTDWAAPADFGNTVALQMDHRIKAGTGVDGPPVALFETRVPLEPKPVRSIVLPDDERIEIYAMTLASG